MSDFVLFLFMYFYSEEPRPEYDPYIKIPRTVITANPPTKATKNKGTLPVSVMEFILLKYYYYYYIMN